MKDFQYAAPASVEEAVSLLADGGPRAKPLAGGTDILVQLREGLREADLVVDLKRIPELTELTTELTLDAELTLAEGGGLTLGAGVACHRIWEDQRLVRDYAALVDAARIIGGWQIQNRATVGGNLCNSSPAADTIPALIALRATCQIAGPDGRRSVPVEAFCTAPGKNVLQRGELLVSLTFPPPAPRGGSHYLRFIPRNEMDIAVAGCGAWLELGEDETIRQARIGLAAVAPTPLFAEEASGFLSGKPATAENFHRAGELAQQIARPIDDLRGPAAYRVHLVGVLVRRALTKAAQRATGS